MSNKEPVIMQVKVLCEKNEEFFIDSNGEVPGKAIDSRGERFDAAHELLDELGLEHENLNDVVRITLEDSSERTYYVLHAKVEGEGTFMSYQEFLESGWKNLDEGYFVPPMRYIDSYLSEENNYQDGKNINVSKVLIEKDGEFMAMKKSHLEKISSGQRFKKYGDMSGKWELPGGRIGKRAGEDRFEAAKREVFEEAGIKLRRFTDVVRMEVEQKNTVNCFILLCRDWHGKPEVSEEHTDYRWVSPREYSELDWHKDAGYGIPPLARLQDYLDKKIQY